MDKSQREFLLILAYLYVRYGKYDEVDRSHSFGSMLFD